VTSPCYDIDQPTERDLEATWSLTQFHKCGQTVQYGTHTLVVYYGLVDVHSQVATISVSNF